MPKSHHYSTYTTELSRLLGMAVAQARRERHWTVAELAKAVGASPVTVRKVEHGDPSVALGTAFEVAHVLGVPLFGADDTPAVRDLVERERTRLELLPARVRALRRPVRDDF